MELSSEVKKLRKFDLIETNTYFYLIGLHQGLHYILKIYREKPNILNVYHYPSSYKEVKIKEEIISKKRCYGFLGFIKFTQGYYMLFITKRKKVGNIGPNKIYEIQETLCIPLEKQTYSFTSMFSKDDEKKYRDLFNSFDLTKNFYFSYDYDLSQSLANNMKNEKSYEKYIWNSYLLDYALQAGMKKEFLISIIHGYIGQKIVSINNKEIYILLIGRRSRYFAGTRYLKRGIHDDGNVANFVETEQIVYEMGSLIDTKSKGSFSSYIQVRGSIPLYWSQTISKVNPKPDVILGKNDPLYQSTQHHFNNLFQRHGSPVICFDLTKQNERHPRESILGKKYRECVQFLNKLLPIENQIILNQWDLKQKSNSQDFHYETNYVIEKMKDSTSFFYTYKQKVQEQKGVIRTNCIDCLDRTNYMQLLIGIYIFHCQLESLKIINDSKMNISASSLEELYEELGNSIAQQYGGSNMVSAGINNKGLFGDIMNSFTRYYSNNFIDENKQHAMNLFLGNFLPEKESINLWELDSDLFLHYADESIVFTTNIFDSPLSTDFLRFKKTSKKNLYSNERSSKELNFSHFYKENKPTLLKYNNKKLERIQVQGQHHPNNESIFLLKDRDDLSELFYKHLKQKGTPQEIFKDKLEDYQIYEEYCEPIHPKKYYDKTIKFVQDTMKVDIDVYEDYFKIKNYNLDLIPEEENDSNGSQQNNLVSKFLNTGLLEKMRKELCKDQNINGQFIKTCFIGKEAVDFVIKNLQIEDREIAVELLNLLQNGQVFHHISFRYHFEDDTNLYRFIQDDPIHILNSIQHKKTNNPLLLSQILMDKISMIFKSHHPIKTPGKNQFQKELDLNIVKNSEEFKEFDLLTNELQGIDISVLNEKEKIVFFINLFNTLFIHGCLILYQGKIDGNIKLTFYKTTYYRVGIFLFSLYDIKHGILRKNQKNYGSILDTFCKDDPRINFCINKVDPRILFLLCQSTYPIFQPFSVNNIEEELQSFARLFYLENIKVRGDLLILPKIFLHYRSDFGDVQNTIKKSLKETDELYLKLNKSKLNIGYK